LTENQLVTPNTNIPMKNSNDNNWTEIRKHLRAKYGKQFSFFNDRNKYTRRIKIYGGPVREIEKYLRVNFPGLVIWYNTDSNGWYRGLCFNTNH